MRYSANKISRRKYLHILICLVFYFCFSQYNCGCGRYLLKHPSGLENLVKIDIKCTMSVSISTHTHTRTHTYIGRLM